MTGDREKRRCSSSSGMHWSQECRVRPGGPGGEHQTLLQGHPCSLSWGCREHRHARGWSDSWELALMRRQAAVPLPARPLSPSARKNGLQLH